MNPINSKSLQTGTALLVTGALVLFFVTILQKHGDSLRETFLGDRRSTSLAVTMQQHWKMMDPVPEQQPVRRSAMAPPVAMTVGYTASGLHDPLQSVLPEEPAPQVPQPPVAGSQIPPPPPAPAIQGIMLGSHKPSVIINGDVYRVGDMLNGTKILSIDRHSITVEFYGKPIVYPIGSTTNGTERSSSSWVR